MGMRMLLRSFGIQQEQARKISQAEAKLQILE